MASERRNASARSHGLAPRIQNISDIGSTFRKGTLIHFTVQQWEQMTAQIPPGKGVPKFGVALTYYPIPDGDVLTQPICIQNPCEMCRIRVSGFGPDGTMTFDCQCRPDPTCPRDPPPPPPSPLCRLGIQRTGGMLRLGCISQGCTRQCRLTAVRQGNRYLLVCRCS